MTNTQKLDDIIADIDWQNYESSEEDQEKGSPEHWDLCEVLFNKLEYLKEHLDTIPGEHEAEHVESIRYIQTILGMLNEKKLRRVIK